MRIAEGCLPVLLYSEENFIKRASAKCGADRRKNYAGTDDQTDDLQF